jgi:hypothetical protein
VVTTISKRWLSKETNNVRPTTIGERKRPSGRISETQPQCARKVFGPPCIVWCSGLLPCREEWQSVGIQFQKIRKLALKGEALVRGVLPPNSVLADVSVSKQSKMQPVQKGPEHYQRRKRRPRDKHTNVPRPSQSSKDAYEPVNKRRALRLQSPPVLDISAAGWMAKVGSTANWPI